MTVNLSVFFYVLLILLAWVLPFIVDAGAWLLHQRKPSELLTFVAAIVWLLSAAIYIATWFVLPWDENQGIVGLPVVVVALLHAWAAISVAEDLFTSRTDEDSETNVSRIDEARRSGTR